MSSARVQNTRYPAPRANGVKAAPAERDYSLVPAADLDFSRLSLGKHFQMGSSTCATLLYDGKPAFTILRGIPVTVAARMDMFERKVIDFKLPEDQQGSNLRTLDEWQTFISFPLPVEMGTADPAEWLRYKTCVYGTDVHFLGVKFPKLKHGENYQVWRENTLVTPEDIQVGEEVDVKLSVVLALQPVVGGDDGAVWKGGWSFTLRELKAGPRREHKGFSTEIWLEIQKHLHTFGDLVNYSKALKIDLPGRTPLPFPPVKRLYQHDFSIDFPSYMKDGLHCRKSLWLFITNGCFPLAHPRIYWGQQHKPEGAYRWESVYCGSGFQITDGYQGPRVKIEPCTIRGLEKVVFKKWRKDNHGKWYTKSG